MQYVIFRGKKIPLVVAIMMSKITNYLIPSNKFNSDLQLSIYKVNNKDR